VRWKVYTNALCLSVVSFNSASRGLFATTELLLAIGGVSGGLSHAGIDSRLKTTGLRGFKDTVGTPPPSLVRASNETGWVKTVKTQISRSLCKGRSGKYE